MCEKIDEISKCQIYVNFFYGENLVLKLKECIYKISESGHFVNELEELYPLIHKILEDIMREKK